MMQQLESRRMMSVDFGLSGISSSLPAKVETTALSTTTATVKVNLVNKGTEAIPKTAPAIGVSFYLHVGAGNDKLIGSVKAVKYAGLKKGGVVPLVFGFSLAKLGLKAGDYSLVATITGETAITGSEPTNNYAQGKTLSVVPAGNTLFATYRFADTIKFTKTTSDTGGGAYTEDGTFVDANGVTGGYIFAISPKVNGFYNTVLTMFRQESGRNNQTYIGQAINQGAEIKTLNGKTGHFSGKPNGGIKVIGNKTSAGTTIYWKI